MKPNCFECKHRREIPGDAHSMCAHPAVGGDGDYLDSTMAMVGGGTSEAARSLGIKGNPTGIRNGWFSWPANFDPTWLDECTGYEQRRPKPSSASR